jgi:hypothetical protein
VDRATAAMQPNVATNHCFEIATNQETKIMLDRRILVGGLFAALAFAGAAQAHHGWTWAEDSTFELTGVIKSAKLGNPHGILKIDAKGEEWTVEVGQPWRNERAGLKNSMLAKGVELTVIGNRAKDKKLKVVKAARIVINGKKYDLYPERVS